MVQVFHQDYLEPGLILITFIILFWLMPFFKKHVGLIHRFYRSPTPEVNFAWNTYDAVTGASPFFTFTELFQC